MISAKPIKARVGDLRMDNEEVYLVESIDKSPRLGGRNRTLRVRILYYFSPELRALNLPEDLATWTVSDVENEPLLGRPEEWL